MKTSSHLSAILSLFLIGLIGGVQAQQLKLLSSPPVAGTFMSIQLNQPPLPFLPLAELNLDVYSFGDVFVYDDRAVDYVSLRAEKSLMRSSISWSSESGPPSPGEGEGGEYDNPSAFAGYNYTNGELWLEIEVDTNKLVYLTAHNTEENLYYQILSKTDLNDSEWVFDQEFFGLADVTPLDPFPLPGTPMKFYEAVQPDVVIHLINNANFGQDIAKEPNASNSVAAIEGIFTIFRTGSTASNVTVHYTISGTASNGVDYTNIPTSVTLPIGVDSTNILISPLEDNLIEFEETVTLTLVRSNGYFPGSDYSATIPIEDYFSSNLFTVVANVAHPVGIDYYGPSNSLLVSYNYDNGQPNNFARIATNGAVTSWSGISGLPEEIKIATVKTTANGFTNGQMYFGTGTDGEIGRLSSDGTVALTNWVTLPNETLLRGSLYIDESGSFGGDLIAVSGAGVIEGGGIWRITSAGTATKLANIPNTHLEGVISLTNDVRKWGPWAGKIIGGAESDAPKPLIYAISTSGTVTSFDLGIAPEDFDIIPPNQDLYCAGEDGAILKLSKSLLTNYVGDLLITQEGAGFPAASQPKLFIVHWDGTNFVKRGIAGPDTFEHVTFAPINIPNL